MIVQLVRYAYLPDVTLGRLTAGALSVFTLEEGWRPDPDGPGGQRREGSLVESCVPDGLYDLVPHSGTKFKRVWALENHDLGVYHWPADVPKNSKFGRSAIVIHPANTTVDILGCIAVGLACMHDGKSFRVVDSALALLELRRVLGTDQKHSLRIRPFSGTSEAPIARAASQPSV